MIHSFITFSGLWIAIQSWTICQSPVTPQARSVHLRLTTDRSLVELFTVIKYTIFISHIVIRTYTTKDRASSARVTGVSTQSLSPNFYTAKQNIRQIRHQASFKSSVITPTTVSLTIILKSIFPNTVKMTSRTNLLKSLAFRGNLSWSLMFCVVFFQSSYLTIDSCNQRFFSGAPWR